MQVGFVRSSLLLVVTTYLAQQIQDKSTPKRKPLSETPASVKEGICFRFTPLATRWSPFLPQFFGSTFEHVLAVTQ